MKRFEKGGIKFSMFKKINLSLIFFLVLLAFWEISVRGDWVPSFILPSPSMILLGLWKYREQLFTVHLFATIEEIILGLLLSVGTAVLLSVAMFFSKTLEKIFYPLLIVSQTIPLIAIAPVFALWFGYSLWMKIAVVVLFSFFPLVVSFYEGFKSTDADLVDLLKTMGANKWQIFYKVQVPMGIPAFFSGLKIVAVYSITGATIGEWLGAEAGLGYFGRRMASSLRSDGVFSSVLLLSLLGLLLFALIGWIEKKTLKHRR